MPPSTLARIALSSALALSLSGSVNGQTGEDYSRQATSLVERQQLREALQILLEGLSHFPKDAELLLQAGSLLVQLGQAEEGEKLLQRALLADPYNPELLRSRAEAELRQGRVGAAIELYRKALWHDSSDAEAHHRLSFSLFLEGDEDGALKHAQKAVEFSPLDAGYRRLYSLLLSVAGQEETSFDQLRMAYRLSPSDPQTLYQLSRREKRRGNLAEAIEYAEVATEIDPENPVYLRELAELWAALGQTREAETSLNRAILLEDAYRKYSEALRLASLSQFEGAIAELRSISLKPSEFPTGQLLLADLLRKQGQPEQALSVYQAALAADPQNRRAREESAWIEFDRGSLDMAVELLRGSDQTALSQGLLEGYQLMLKEDWPAALERLRSLQGKDPLNAVLLQLISFCLDEMGLEEEALRELARLKSLTPTDKEVDSRIRAVKLDQALSLQESGRCEAAIPIFDEALAFAVDAFGLFSRAYCFQQLGRIDRAVEDYRQGLQLEPAAEWARLNLASSLYLARRYEESAKEWGLLSKTDDSPLSQTQLGLCLSQLGRDAEAEAAFQKAIQLGGRDAELVYNLGITQLRLMQLESAWANIRAAAGMGHLQAKRLVAEADRRRPRQP